MPKIAVIGEGVIDRFLTPVSHIDVIGGSGLNTAVAMKRAEADVVWFTRLANDSNGLAISQYAKTEGVLADSPIHGDEPASLVEVTLKEDGQPNYTFALEGAVDWAWSATELSGLAQSFDVIQISSLSAVLDPGADLILSTIQALRNNLNPPLISYDPNARPSAAKDEEQASQMRTRIKSMVENSDLVKVSDEDLTWLNPDHDPIETAKHWSTLGPKLLVLTRGAHGSKAFSNGQEIASIESESIEVKDTVGAGDTFMAWLVAQIATEFNCLIPAESNHITSLLEKASRAAAITCSREGCKPPYANEVI